MEIQEYLNKTKEFYHLLLNYIDCKDDTDYNYTTFINYISSEN